MSTPTHQESAADVVGSGEGLHVPVERFQMKQLLAINPNYFGTLTESQLSPVVKLAGNTTYEELTCVGYNPATTVLEATVAVKQNGGYSGTLCGPGSYEYVRFYLDYGAGWEDAGVASINVHDIADGTDCAGQPWFPLSYAASLQLSPHTSPCSWPRLPKVRAILSWQTIPNDPDFTPVWGNVVETTIQIKPRSWFLVEVVDQLAELNQVKLTLPDDLAYAEKIPLPQPDPGPLSLAELAKVYAGGQVKATGDAAAKTEAAHEVAVPSHRFGFSELLQYTQASSTSAKTFEAKVGQWKQAGLDWSEAVKALLDSDGDVDYEELECLGLNNTLDRVEATFRVKRSTGYGGTLCQSGSTEYVAFWAVFDDDDCDWTYLGTANVQVHDIASIPDGGISYAAALPVDLTHQRRECGSPRVVRLRAVLSWATPPSTTDADEVPYWGNRIDRHAQIAPGPVVPPGTVVPLISIIGGIPVHQIDANGVTTPTAHFSLLGGSTTADPEALGRPCPFARVVAVQGPAYVGHSYRVQVREVGSPSWQTLNQNFTVTDQFGNDSVQSAVGDYYPSLDDTVNQDNLLAVWSTADDTLWEVKLDIAGIAGDDGHKVQLHNTAPVAEIHINPLAGDCSKHTVGTVLDGTYVARDDYLSSYSLGTLPFAAPAGQLTPTGALVQTPLGGSVWTLDTGTPADMQPCGYVLALAVSSRAIYNSSPSYRSSPASVGFCLDAPA
ncbi:MAG: hypothetical protein WKF54_12115 [Nocardioidaceae bacterium]